MFKINWKLHLKTIAVVAGLFGVSFGMASLPREVILPILVVAIYWGAYGILKTRR
jgi:hypothetical protein